MICLESEYYEKEIFLDEVLQETLFDMYMRISENHDFEPEIESPEEICDSTTFDHIAYHIETYKKELHDFREAKHLFE